MKRKLKPSDWGWLSLYVAITGGGLSWDLWWPKPPAWYAENWDYFASYAVMFVASTIFLYCWLRSLREWILHKSSLGDMKQLHVKTLGVNPRDQRAGIYKLHEDAVKSFKQAAAKPREALTQLSERLDSVKTMIENEGEHRRIQSDLLDLIDAKDAENAKLKTELEDLRRKLRAMGRGKGAGFPGEDDDDGEGGDGFDSGPAPEPPTPSYNP